MHRRQPGVPDNCTVDTDCADGAFCSTLGTCIAAQLVFTTSTTTLGNIGGLAGADAFCQARATATQRRGVFRPWLSDSTTSAGSRVTHAARPYVFPNGIKLADDYTDLTDGTIDAPFEIDELGQQVSSNIPFTATDEQGNHQGSTCANWTSNAGAAGTGKSDTTEPGWSLEGDRANTCSVLHRLYCIQN